MTTRTRDNLTSPDFVPRADRHPGLRIGTYRVDSAGTRYDRIPLIEVDVVPGDPGAYHPDKGWPLCTCARCRTEET
ncbi:hypothetical protein ACIRRH_35950 [Kitasatospora sp. NPDC101235]|uniref:hypothetical protein n=1 Tax=Kitasatospora sp. NPDC101235 TaxID=3364101 RepID=UPI00381E5EB5